MKPSNYCSFPFGSLAKNNESETVAQNIMKILKRTGDTFRELSYEEYKLEREKDGNFTINEKNIFEHVRKFTVSKETADIFCTSWGQDNKK